MPTVGCRTVGVREKEGFALDDRRGLADHGISMAIDMSA